jgi:hypothetical protein
MAGKSILIAGILLSLLVPINNAFAAQPPTIADWKYSADNGDWWDSAN